MKQDKKLVELKRGHKLTSVQVIQHKEEVRGQGNIAVSKSSWKATEIEVLLSWLTEVASVISLGMVFHGLGAEFRKISHIFSFSFCLATSDKTHSGGSGWSWTNMKTARDTQCGLVISHLKLCVQSNVPLKLGANDTWSQHSSKHTVLFKMAHHSVSTATIVSLFLAVIGFLVAGCWTFWSL